MAEQLNKQPYGTIAQKWRDLAERRRAYFAELYSSGRWKHYYTEEQFVARMREVVNAADAWTQLVQRPDGQGVAAK
jgi:uncharacterized repeat protein (TIGR03809 family)